MNFPGLTREGAAKLKLDQDHLLGETQLGLETAKSTPEQDQNFLYPVIQCDNNSHAQHHSPRFNNIFTDQSNMNLSTFDNIFAKSTPEHDQNVRNFVIQCVNNSHEQQHSSTFDNIFTDQSKMNLSIFDYSFTDESNMNLPTFDHIITAQSNVNLDDEFIDLLLKK